MQCGHLKYIKTARSWAIILTYFVDLKAKVYFIILSMTTPNEGI